MVFVALCALGLVLIVILRNHLRRKRIENEARMRSMRFHPSVVARTLRIESEDSALLKAAERTR
jgi:hypothetical protein